LHEAYERESVERGAALLDKKLPGWADKIQRAMFDGRFEMAHWDSCIAGTLELVKYGTDKNVGEAIKKGTLAVGIALNGILIVDEKEAASYGFYPANKSESGGWNHRLGELWKDQVNQRVRVPVPS
jgi:hypothetical protein